MTRTICFYEDAFYQSFYPLTLMRPVYLLRTGMVERFRCLSLNDPKADTSFACRTQVEPLVKHEWPDFAVNRLEPSSGEVLFLNGRLRDEGDLFELADQADPSTRFVTKGNEVAAVLLKPDLVTAIKPGAGVEQVEKLGKDLPSVKTTSTMYRHAWDMIGDIEGCVASDFGRQRSDMGDSDLTNVHKHATLVNEQEIHVGPDVRVCPGAVIDASHGPVYVGAGSTVESFAAIYGPCYIGDDCLILAGKLSGSSIGAGCRVGGEVEASVFHSNVNKYHAGFIGHSYVAPWVNFGAMTTNSDLKNNYSDIRVSLGGEMVDTGLMKLGSLIGDHTKFGIGTLLNTGINIGVCCNIFGGSLIADKQVPSFKWGSSESYLDYRIDKAIETARIVKERRGLKLSTFEEDMLKAIAAGGDDEHGVLSFENV